MRMMRRRVTKEDAYWWLRGRIGEFVEPLLAEVEKERDIGVQADIVELLADARDVRALPVFLKHCSSSNYWLRTWAIWGLRGLNEISGGRKALWDLYWRRAPPPILLSVDDELLVHKSLEDILRADVHDHRK